MILCQCTKNYDYIYLHDNWLGLKNFFRKETHPRDMPILRQCTKNYDPMLFGCRVMGI